jgi:hypothetical protein
MEMKILMSDTIENLPIASDKITQHGLVGGFSYGSRSYNFSQSITHLAEDKFRKTGKGLTYKGLRGAI